MRNPISQFSYADSGIDIQRSVFDRNTDHKFTMSAGLLYPCYVDEYMPGDTFSVDLSALVRMSTPIHPIMDNAFMDVMFFSVPYRLVWDHFKEFMGESPVDPYLNPVEYSIPQLKSKPFISAPDVPKRVIPHKSVLDYMGYPAGCLMRSGSALFPRGFSLIWNHWFRDQNLQHSIDVDLGDADQNYVDSEEFSSLSVDGDDYIRTTARGGVLPPVNKYHDYFTSSLLQPQKGDPVPIPLSGFAPVIPVGMDVTSYLKARGAYYPTILADPAGNLKSPSSSVLGTNEEFTGYGEVIGSTMVGNITNAITGYSDALNFGNLYAALAGAGHDKNPNVKIDGVPLGAYATINDLRYAFQIQKLLERDARGGTRYREIIKSHFSVDGNDASLQIPEFLGGKRIRINISQVLQTSSTDATSPQGNTAAYSLTSDKMNGFTKSFTEHGMIIGVCCIRTEHSYQQGLNKMFKRKDRYDFYWPELANISEQPVYVDEIYSNNQPNDKGDGYAFFDEDVFGFQEAHAEYRYKPNTVAGEFRSNYPGGSLDVWHYADYFDSRPILSDQFIRESRVNIDRTLAVSSNVSDQFICDFYYKVKAYRPMPVTSVPGLSDHH